MLKLRKRGETWHIRGTLRVGSRVWTTEGESTGCRDEAAAKAVLIKRSAQIQADLLGDRDPDLRRLRFDDVADSYLTRPTGVHPSDQIRLDLLDAHFGTRPLAELIDPKRAGAEWREFCRKRLIGKSPGTLNRHRTVYLAILNRAAAEHGFTVPKIPAEDYDPVRVRYLSKEDEDVLLASYSPHAQMVADFLCDTGRRVGETLRLDRRHVDLGRAEAFFPDPKSGEPQACILLRRAQEAVRRALARPKVVVTREDGTTWWPLFVGLRGPYHDTRAAGGGNPITKAHTTACARAGIEDFRVHDWRHHFATWRLKEGWDLAALKKQCGWASYEMLEKYASVDLEHVHAQERRRLVVVPAPKRTKSGQTKKRTA